MTQSLNRLLWRRYRTRFWALLVLSVVIGVGLAILNSTNWQALMTTSDFFTADITKWQVYNDPRYSVSFYTYWVVFIYWLVGIVLVYQDRRENFDQFLFASGYRRHTIYWTKLALAFGGLLVITVLTMAAQYGVYWLNIPARMTFNFAWPGFITTWVVNLAMSWGFFAIAWFAALILGQTWSLLVTLGGFTISLIGVATFIQGLLAKWTTSQLEWLSVGLWLTATVILLVWGAYLYDRVTLEHVGEYLMFPALRTPVYIVFVVYMTALFTVNATDLEPAVVTFIITTVFGYWWLWRPTLTGTWHRRHES